MDTSYYLAGVSQLFFIYFCILNTFLGTPSLNMMLWAGLRFSFDERNTKVKHCFLMEKSEWDLVTNIPCIIILICNTFFLIWIMLVRKYKNRIFLQITIFIARLLFQNYDSRQLWLMTTGTSRQQRYQL